MCWGVLSGGLAPSARTPSLRRWPALLCLVRQGRTQLTRSSAQMPAQVEQLECRVSIKVWVSAGKDGFNRSYDGYLVGADKSRDLAVLRIAAPKVRSVPRFLGLACMDPTAVDLCWWA